MKTDTTIEPQGQTKGLRCDALVRRLREQTCGELTCTECNAQRSAAADEIERVQRANLLVGPITAVEVKCGYAIVTVEVDYESGQRIISGQFGALFLPNTSFGRSADNESARPVSALKEGAK